MPARARNRLHGQCIDMLAAEMISFGCCYNNVCDYATRIMHKLPKTNVS